MHTYVYVVRVYVEDSGNVYRLCASRIFSLITLSFASLMYCECITVVTPLGLPCLGLIDHGRVNFRFGVSLLCLCGTVSCNWYLS